jgi:hypothetical protein
MTPRHRGLSEKIVSAGRRSQHARRVRSPDSDSILFVRRGGTHPLHTLQRYHPAAHHFSQWRENALIFFSLSTISITMPI